MVRFVENHIEENFTEGCPEQNTNYVALRIPSKGLLLALFVILLNINSDCMLSLAMFQGVKMEAMRFRFDGQPINETDTPSQVCFQHQQILFVPEIGF